MSHWHYQTMATVVAFASTSFAVLMLSFANVAATSSQVFEVTDFGAAAGSHKDNSAAFLAAWAAACRYEGDAAAMLVIPHGTFMLEQAKFRGPCRGRNGASPTVVLKGVVRAFSQVSYDAASSSGYWLKFEDLSNLTLTGGGTLDGQGAFSWLSNDCHHHRNCKLPPATLKFEQVINATIEGIRLVDGKSFHMKINKCDHINVRNITVRAPGDSPNTDGLHISRSSHVSVTDSDIGTGDDCVSIGQGARDVLVSNITCGPGHGISVGSLGKYENEEDVAGITVKNCTLTGTTNGLRIKTWAASPASRAYNFTFENITMIDVSNPIIINQQYCPVYECSDKPSKVEISDVKFIRIKGTSKSKVAVKLLCSDEVPCKRVELQDINLSRSKGEGETTSSCAHVYGSYSGSEIPSPCLTST